MNLAGSDDIFAARLMDLVALSKKSNSPRFSMFLDERQVYLAERKLANVAPGCVSFFGGYPEASRKICCVHPDFLAAEQIEFPIAALTAHYRSTDSLSHRDFLGSLMALGIKREILGDILVGKGMALIYVFGRQLPYLMENIRKIGRVGVRLTEGADPSFVYTPAFEEISGTVASMRLDSMIALAVGTSREKAVKLIKEGLVAVNYEQVDSVKQLLKVGDIFSVRGYGKYILQENVRKTKKERLYLTVKKYL